MSSSKVSKFCSNSALVFGIFFKFEISDFPAGFSFRQALSRLALFTLLCCLVAALPRVQARRRFVLLRCDIYIGNLLCFTCLIMKSFDYLKTFASLFDFLVLQKLTDYDVG